MECLIVLNIIILSVVVGFLIKYTYSKEQVIPDDSRPNQIAATTKNAPVAMQKLMTAQTDVSVRYNFNYL